MEKKSDKLFKLAMILAKFRDMDANQTIAAVDVGDKVIHLTYGDLREMYHEYTDVDARLARISVFHSRETGPGGMVGDFCVECGTKWPCDTRRLADG